MIISPYKPSFDFELFDLPQFSELYANEFGASSSFSAQMPSGYVDYSLSRLFGLTQTPNTQAFERSYYPNNGDLDLLNLLGFFQSGTGDLPKRPDIIEVFPYPNPQGAQSDRERIEAEARRQGRSAKDIILDIPGNVRRGAEVVVGIPGNVAKGAEVVATDVGAAAKTGKTIAEIFKSLPSGSGTFLIAIVAIILLVLFLKR